MFRLLPLARWKTNKTQALSAEFPTTARVRPVFHNMADIFDMLHERPNTKEGPAQQSVVPFEGRLLVFKRGNGVEETKGRLLLKKLDYVQASDRGVRAGAVKRRRETEREKGSSG